MTSANIHTVLYNALATLEQRNADLAAAGERDWDGEPLIVTIDEAQTLQDPDVRKAVDHLVRYGRHAGVKVSIPTAAGPS